MSGHSKWATTKHRKAAVDAKRSTLFSKLTRIITVAAKTGGDPNPENNASLAAAIAKAKSYSLPKDKIDIAIKKAFGAGGGRELRGGHLRGLRPCRRGALRRGAHRQPQPHRRRRPRGVHAGRRQPRRDGLGRVPVRAQGPDPRRQGGERRRGRAHAPRGHGRRRRGPRRRRRRVGRVRPARPTCCCQQGARGRGRRT